MFISHSTVDTWVARHINQEIQSCGAATFLDEASIEVGAEFEEEIVAALNQADEFVVLLLGH